MVGKKAALSLAILAPAALAQQSAYGQCGGTGWTGPTSCISGYTCAYSNDFYSQCVPGTAATTSKTSVTKTSSKTTSGSAKTSSPSSLKTTAAPTSIKTSATTLSTKTTSASSGPVVTTGCTATCTVGYCTLNGGTTGGFGGTSTTVSTLDALTAAAAGDAPKIVYVSGTISGNAQVDVGANTHIIGKSGSQLIGVGLRIIKTSNVIVRNMKISKCLAPIDNIAIQESTNVLIDHADLSSDQQHDKDYYDGLLDMSHATDFVTVSNVYFHDHFKGSLIGHSDNNGAQDTGHLRVTEYRNRWYNVNSRGPSLRWGTGHIVNSYYENMSLGYASRDNAQMLVEYNQFVNVTEVDYNESDITGYVVTRGNDFGGGTPTLPVGTLSSVPYSYETIAVTAVNGYTKSNAGQVLSC